MELYFSNDNYKLYQGNMLDMLEVIDKESIESIVCDPPYELNFMGKGWDNSGVAFNKETWERCYNVLKPGGYLLVFGGSRTFHRIACAIEDSGFEIRDTIMWLYGSGFTKSMDISKAIDKKGGNNYSIEFAKDLKEAREKRNLTQKYCDDKYCNGSTNWSWYEGRKDGCRVPDYETYLKIVEDFNELEKYRELIKEAEREVIGQKEKLESYKYKNNNVYQTNGNKEKITLDITKPTTDLAKQWQGWGTSLKPAFEPIIVARKPFKGSLVDNIIKNGVGGINIDECRIGNEERTQFSERSQSKSTVYNSFNQENARYETVQGRFPANTILTYDETDFEEVCGGFPNTKSTSRYFYCAKASTKDRDEGLNDGDETLRKNTHPTVKPTTLMQYLVRLVSPNGATILDPFMGSGSTGKAVMYENKDRNTDYKFIGIELTEEYLPIAKARIGYIYNLKDEELKEKQLTLFKI